MLALALILIVLEKKLYKLIFPKQSATQPTIFHQPNCIASHHLPMQNFLTQADDLFFILPNQKLRVSNKKGRYKTRPQSNQYLNSQLN